MYLPAWSKHTVPHRGKIVHVEQSFVEILHAELTFLERQRHNILAGELAHVQRQLTAPENEPLTEDETDDSDTEYTIPHDRGQRDLQVAIREYQLRPRPALADITPTPDVVNAAHLDLLNFRRVKWDEPRPFVNLQNRIGAMFIGPPTERTLWENTIIEANNIMRIASAHLDRAKLEGDSIRSGIEYDAVLKRPRSIDRRHNLSNMVVLAALRYSPTIQEITSFQNALLCAIMPRLREDTSRVIDAVVGNDSSLHLPMDPTNDGPYQPTAFSELEYRFSIPDSVPRRDTDDHPSSFRALTAVGHYDSGQGDLVLWRERTVVEFPPGSTFLFPAGLVHYSFSAVEKPGRQMLISQSCSAGLHGYVENGFDDRFRSVGKTSSSMERRHIAKGAIELYSKIAEYDAAAETYAK